ncbi:hypothetical protein Q5O24_09755 [Eubacteriaceae bacterium ES3]|nr:hypothetical protein Q5O24_09755 [Eubacteriaceae bacterium ES3]
MTFVRADKFISGEEIQDEDMIVYEMPEEQKEHIRKLVEAYDNRDPFDIQKCKIEFADRQKLLMKENGKKIPEDIYKQIADPRVFALGYSTKDIIQKLKQISRRNEIKVEQQLVDFQQHNKQKIFPRT